VRIRLYPNIYIHCWGGLGSQLFAWILMAETKEKFKHRRVKLVMHESGITLRKSEISSFLLSSEIFEVHDFNTRGRFFLQNKVSRIFNWLKRFIKFVSIKFGLLAYCNTEEDFKKIKPWILQIRGHYSNRIINNDFVNDIIASLWLDFGKGSELEINDLIALHFRLGDLLNLKTKKPLGEYRVIEGINRLSEILTITEITIFSDSGFTAADKLTKAGCRLKISLNNLEILPTLKMLVFSKAFIATPSKISEWVIILRIFLGIGGPILVPIEMHEHLVRIYPSILQSQWVHVY